MPVFFIISIPNKPTSKKEVVHSSILLNINVEITFKLCTFRQFAQKSVFNSRNHETRNEESQRTIEKKTTTHIEKRQKECLNNALEIDNAMCVHINTRSVGTIPVKTLTNHIYAENVKQSAKSLK